MVTIFKHHISMWSLVEIVADLALCFLAVVLAVDRLPLSFDGQPLPHPSPVDLSVAVAFAFFMALLYSFAGLYRQRGALRIGLPLLLGRAFMAMAMGSCIAYLALGIAGDGRYAYPLLLYAVPFMFLGFVAVRGVGYLGRRSALGARRVLIVGTGPEARNVAIELGTSSALAACPGGLLSRRGRRRERPIVRANGGADVRGHACADLLQRPVDRGIGTRASGRRDHRGGAGAARCRLADGSVACVAHSRHSRARPCRLLRTDPGRGARRQPEGQLAGLRARIRAGRTSEPSSSATSTSRCRCCSCSSPFRSWS